MFTIILYILLAYFLYRFIFYFIIPIVSTSRQVHRQMKDFHQRMQQPETGSYQYHEASTPKKESNKTGNLNGDYIEFEEIK